MTESNGIAVTPSIATAPEHGQGSARTKLKDVLLRVATGVHRALFTVSKGRLFGRVLGMPVVKLVTTGRRSGRERTTMLTVPIVDGERLVLVASFGGDDRH